AHLSAPSFWACHWAPPRPANPVESDCLSQSAGPGKCRWKDGAGLGRTAGPEGAGTGLPHHRTLVRFHAAAEFAGTGRGGRIYVASPRRQVPDRPRPLRSPHEDRTVSHLRIRRRTRTDHYHQRDLVPRNRPGRERLRQCRGPAGGPGTLCPGRNQIRKTRELSAVARPHQPDGPPRRPRCPSCPRLFSNPPPCGGEKERNTAPGQPPRGKPPPPRPLASGKGPVVSLACAPDGKTIFFAARGVVWSVPSAGSATPEARRIRVGDGVVADPSGTKILVRGMEGSEIHLFSVPLDGSAERKIPLGKTDPVAPVPLAPNALSPDGRLL